MSENLEYVTMNEPTLQLLFPIPVVFNYLNRDFTKEELDFVQENFKKKYRNVGNNTSDNTFILDEPQFKNLKDLIQEHIESYISLIYKPKSNVTPYITQSWLNWTEPGEYHHMHKHRNSLISGVLYIDAVEDLDKIVFYKDVYDQFDIQSKTYDECNSTRWWFSIKKGKIVLFPSTLLHGVDNVESNKTRISLAFNAFIKGTLGNKDTLTELTIK
jgi:uncharacterized protein (TIGR02466 family)